MSFRVPDPPPTASLRPLLFTWERRRPLVRCHSIRFASIQFNPGMGIGRFHPLQDARGNFVPTLYAAEDLAGSLSETVFHSVPIRGPRKKVRRIVLKSLVVSTLECDRDLRLAQLFGFGLGRLGVTRRELIEASRRQFPRTAAWARAIHDCDDRIDGLIWVSRPNDSTRSLILFGDRVPAPALSSIGVPLPLKDGPGYDAVLEAADQAGIALFD